MAKDLESAKPKPAGASRTAEIRMQLDRILLSPGFQGANRRARLLRFLVEQTLEERGDSLKESVIAAEVFERAPDYDPQVDSVVRVEVGRLRSRLVEYYGQAGQDQPVRIEIPKGGYRPEFVFRDAAPETVTDAPDRVPPPQQNVILPSRKLPDWKLAVAATIAIAVLAGVFWWTRTVHPANPTSIAVLPFLNLSGDPANEYLGDGISEEVTEALSQSPGLQVVARTSAFQYKGRAADVREIGRKLGAGAVLEGSVARRGQGLHVVAQLIRARDGYHLWSQSYDGSAADLPSVEDQITQTVNQELDPAVAVRETIAARNPEAHDLYLRAAHEFSRRSPDSARRAIGLAKQAIEKDPSYAQPYVLMASAESLLTTLQVQAPRPANERARQDIAKALELDPRNNAAHAQKAMLDYIDGWDWPQAEREFQFVLGQGSHGSAENLYGWCLMTRGRFAESRKHLQIAAELDPLSLGPQLNQVEELTAEGSLKEARRKAEEIVRIAPTSFVALSLLAAVAFYQHDCPNTIEWSQKLLHLYPQVPYTHLNALAADVGCGHMEGSQAKFQEILSGHPPGFISPHYLAASYGALGDPDRAMFYLQKSADLREPTLLYLKIDKGLDKMRQDPRFIALERRIGLLD